MSNRQPPQPNQAGSASQMNWKVLGRVLRYISQFYRSKLIIAAVCVLLSAVASVAANLFMQKIIDEVIIPGLTSGLAAVAKTMASLISALVTIYLIGLVASWLRGYLMAEVTQGTLMHLREDMFDHMETLPIRYFDTHAHGDIMSVYTNDTDSLRQMINESLTSLISSAMTLIFIVVMMFYYSLWMTLLAAVFVGLLVAVTRDIGGKSARYMVEQQNSLGREEGYIEEMMTGQKVVKVFNHEDASRADFKKLNDDLAAASRKANRYSNILMPVLTSIGNLEYVAVAVLGGILVTMGLTNLSLQGAGTLTIGVVASFLSMSRQLTMAISQVSSQFSSIASAMAGAQRIFAIIDEPSETDEGYVTLVNAEIGADGQLKETDHQTGLWAWKHYHKADGTTTYQKLEGDIQMVDVDFAYEPDKQVLFDISLYAHPGQKIAFVGATGAGKTTITNLINRFYDVADGKIRYDGINITKIKKPDLRRSLGMVLQDVNLFTGTVMDNIRYGKLDATDEECIAAAKLANADDFITRLPQGYQTMLTNNGSELSQGQRQLISIARAAVADPPVMILDEATSSIDTRTESLVQKGMDNLMKGRTVFVIAHRLSTVRNSDAIMVLDHGRIIERGTHQQLLDQKGVYYQLYTGAFELE
jgi:ATP-binding cassette subfamily B protein